MLFLWLTAKDYPKVFLVLFQRNLKFVIIPAEELKMERLVAHTKEKLERHETALAIYKIQVDQLSKQLKGYLPELIQLKSVNSAVSSKETDLEKILRQDIELSDSDSKKNTIYHLIIVKQFYYLHYQTNKDILILFSHKYFILFYLTYYIHFLNFYWNGEVYYYVCLLFRILSAPRKFPNLLKHIVTGIENFKKEIVFIVHQIAYHLTLDNADVQILDNITGFLELGNMMCCGLMDVSHYKIIFRMVDRFDLLISNSEYTYIIRYAVDNIREKKSKVVIALCPSIVQPADAPAQKFVAQGRTMAPCFKFPFQ